MTPQQFCETLDFKGSGTGINTPPATILSDLLRVWQCFCLSKDCEGYRNQVTLSFSHSSDRWHKTSLKTQQMDKDLWSLYDGANLFAYNGTGNLVFNPRID